MDLPKNSVNKYSVILSGVLQNINDALFSKLSHLNSLVRPLQFLSSVIVSLSSFGCRPLLYEIWPRLAMLIVLILTPAFYHSLSWLSRDDEENRLVSCRTECLLTPSWVRQ